MKAWKGYGHQHTHLHTHTHTHTHTHSSLGSDRLQVLQNAHDTAVDDVGVGESERGSEV